jgi:hypothetical protein
MTTDESPPERATGSGWHLSRHRRITRSGRSSTGLLLDFPIWRNTRIVEVRYCLESDLWDWLEWEAACNTGGWLP